MDLVGGYYDAGDNVKFGLPMAFTITTLSWAAIFYEAELGASEELENVRAAIKWGTDYFLKASSQKNRLYVQVSPTSAGHFVILVVVHIYIYVCICEREMIVLNVKEGGRPRGRSRVLD